MIETTCTLLSLLCSLAAIAITATQDRRWAKAYRSALPKMQSPSQLYTTPLIQEETT